VFGGKKQVSMFEMTKLVNKQPQVVVDGFHSFVG
jgi:hypothetical protein